MTRAADRAAAQRLAAPRRAAIVGTQSHAEPVGRRVRPMRLVHQHMSDDLLTVDAAAPIVAVAQRMADRNVGAVLVLEDRRLAGS